MNFKRVILSVILLLSLCGCSAFRDNTQTINITCNVPDTILKVDGDKKPCPSQVEVRRDKKITIEAYKPGYDRYYKIIDYHLSTAAKWDVVGTCAWFFPVIGFAYPGAWDLDTTEVQVELNEVQTQTNPQTGISPN